MSVSLSVSSESVKRLCRHFPHVDENEPAALTQPRARDSYFNVLYRLASRQAPRTAPGGTLARARDTIRGFIVV